METQYVKFQIYRINHVKDYKNVEFRLWKFKF